MAVRVTLACLLSLAERLDPGEGWRAGCGGERFSVLAEGEGGTEGVCKGERILQRVVEGLTEGERQREREI